MILHSQQNISLSLALSVLYCIVAMELWGAASAPTLRDSSINTIFETRESRGKASALDPKDLQLISWDDRIPPQIDSSWFFLAPSQPQFLDEVNFQKRREALSLEKTTEFSSPESLSTGEFENTLCATETDALTPDNPSPLSKNPNFGGKFQDWGKLTENCQGQQFGETPECIPWDVEFPAKEIYVNPFDYPGRKRALPLFAHRSSLNVFGEPLPTDQFSLFRTPSQGFLEIPSENSGLLSILAFRGGQAGSGPGKIDDWSFASGELRDSWIASTRRANLDDGTAELIRWIYSSVFFIDSKIAPGNSFRVMYHDSYLDDGRVSRDVYFVQLQIGGKDFYALRYFINGQVRYFDENGVDLTPEFSRHPFRKSSISSDYGYRTDPFSGKWKFHYGIDYAKPKGTQVPAAGPGIVSHLSYSRTYGNVVMVDHIHGLKTVYAHLQGVPRTIRQGSLVLGGQTIGYVGSTGKSTGPHLHYEVRKNNKKLNPETVKLPRPMNLEGDEIYEFMAQGKELSSRFFSQEAPLNRVEVANRTEGDVQAEKIGAEGGAGPAEASELAEAPKQENSANSAKNSKPQYLRVGQTARSKNEEKVIASLERFSKRPSRNNPKTGWMFRKGRGRFYLDALLEMQDPLDGVLVTASTSSGSGFAGQEFEFDWNGETVGLGLLFSLPLNRWWSTDLVFEYKTRQAQVRFPVRTGREGGNSPGAGDPPQTQGRVDDSPQFSFDVEANSRIYGIGLLMHTPTSPVSLELDLRYTAEERLLAVLGDSDDMRLDFDINPSLVFFRKKPEILSASAGLRFLTKRGDGVYLGLEQSGFGVEGGFQSLAEFSFEFGLRPGTGMGLNLSSSPDGKNFQARLGVVFKF